MAEIRKVAVIGAGVMGAGIAAHIANAGVPVVLLDIVPQGANDHSTIARGAVAKMLKTNPAPFMHKRNARLIETGNLEDDLGSLADCDWICEAIIENPQIKRDLYKRLNEVRKPGSIVTSNTSTIPLNVLTEGLGEDFAGDFAITHFFNPPRYMRLLEVVKGAKTRDDAFAALKQFGDVKLGKEVVDCKDTPGFIGNRIGCFLMLSGLHKAKAARAEGLSQETIDALISAPVGLPPTGLYGLIDLIGLDVMYLVGRNLATNLPADDTGHAFTSFPEAEQRMFDTRQLGRKSGGGFYRMIKDAEGNRSKEVFDLDTGNWRAESPATLTESQRAAETLMFEDSVEGRFAWDLMGGTLSYAADLVPQISDDVVNIDRAMRWGFAWRKGPFEFLDQLGPRRVIERLQAEGKPLPAMLQVLADAGAESFYLAEGSEYLGLDGAWHATPPE